MKSRFISIAALLSLVLPLHAETGATQLAKATLQGDESISTPHGTIELQDNYPTDASFEPSPRQDNSFGV
jgi:hypothetical protein